MFNKKREKMREARANSTIEWIVKKVSRGSTSLQRGRYSMEEDIALRKKKIGKRNFSVV